MEIFTKEAVGAESKSEYEFIVKRRKNILSRQKVKTIMKINLYNGH
jgi:hypothetical protein